MNTISKQIGYDYTKNKPLEEQVFCGPNYRISVLSDSLVRLEYNEKGHFEDRPTVLASNRLFKSFNFSAIESEFKLKIQTQNFRLTYKKGKPFKGSYFLKDVNLKIELLGTTKIWHYEHPEVRNYGAPGKFLTDEKGKINFIKGLYSDDGFACIDDSKSPVILENGDVVKREKGIIDLYVFMYKQDFGKCLMDYYNLTGYPPMLPRYALGNWWSRDIGYNDEEVRSLIKDFDDNDIPLSLLLLNHDWHIHTYENKDNIKSGFTFDTEKFPNILGIIEDLHKRDVWLGLSIDPTAGIYPYEEKYNDYKTFMESNDTIIPFNAFSSKNYIAYFNFLIKPLLDKNIDAFWINNNDLDVNVQAILNIYSSANVMNLNKRIMLLTDSALVAPHKYPILYSGNSVVNWNTLKKIPFHNLSATNMGVSWWSHDIGGFYKGTEDNELYTRFVQLGVFSPIFKFGSSGGKYYKREPWLWEIKTYQIVKSYLNLRHSLIPYLYTEMFKNHVYGMPLIKPLYYKNPSMYDDMTYRNEYYFGSEFFVAPIIDKKDIDMNRVIHRFYLPDGDWYEFFSGKKFIGNKKYLYFVKIEDYPVFVKAGGIIVLAHNEKNDISNPQNIEVHIFPGQSNKYNLYEDDGISYDFNLGDYLVTSFEYNYKPNNYVVTIKPASGRTLVVPKARNYKIRFRNTNDLGQINVLENNVSIHYESYLDDNDLIIEVKNINPENTLLINITGDNINIDSNRIINDEIASIINDLQLETEMKERIDSIVFSDLAINKKRIAIRKLERKKLEKRYINLFLKLLEYVN